MTSRTGRDDIGRRATPRSPSAAAGAAGGRLGLCAVVLLAAGVGCLTPPTVARCQTQDDCPSDMVCPQPGSFCQAAGRADATPVDAMPADHAAGDGQRADRDPADRAGDGGSSDLPAPDQSAGDGVTGDASDAALQPGDGAAAEAATLDAAAPDSGCPPALELCDALALGCGVHDVTDACGQARRVECGCPAGQGCGADGQPGICGTRLCSVDGWCWRMPWPHGLDLKDLWVFADDDLWVVGAAGLLAHWDGQGWRLVETGVRVVLRALWAAGPTDLWVGGDSGTLLRSDGSSVTRVTFAGAVKDIWGSSGHDVWVASSDQGLWHWDGSALTRDTSAPAQLDALWGHGASLLYAVGAAGSVLQLDGGGWSSLDTGLTAEAHVHTVWGTGPTDLWIGGWISGTLNDGFVRHFDGQQWVDRTPSTSPSYVSLWGRGDGQVWAGGCCALQFEWSQGAWHQIGPPWSGGSTLGYFTGLHAASGSAVHALGNQGLMALHDGGRWTLHPAIEAAGLGQSLSGLFSTDDGVLWAAGFDGTLIRDSAQGWQRVTTFQGLHSIEDLWGFADDDLWAAASSGDLVRWTGTAQRVLTASSPLRGVWGVGPQDVWAVGDAGTVWRVQDGTAQPATAPTTQDLAAVTGRAVDDLWIVGASGTALHFDGGAWQDRSNPAAAGLLDAWQAPSGPLFAVDARSRLWRWSADLGWRQLCLGPSIRLTSVRGLTETEVWAGGYSGSLLRYDGSGCEVVPTNLATTQEIMGVWVEPRHRVCVATSFGHLLCRQF